MAPTTITFPSFTVSKASLYVVQGLEKFSIYHAIQALEEQGNERKFLLFLPQGGLSVNIVNYEEWTNCKRATISDESEKSENYNKICFDVGSMRCKTEYDILYARSEDDVKLAVDKKEMFIFDLEILNVIESVFPLKLRKSGNQREIRSIIDINTAHLLVQETERVKTKFLTYEDENFLTKVHILNKQGGKKKNSEERCQ